MSLESKKIQLIDWIVNLQNVDDIDFLHNYKESKEKVEWAIELSEKEKNSFLKGINEFENKKFVNQDDLKKRLGKLL